MKKKLLITFFGLILSFLQNPSSIFAAWDPAQPDQPADIIDLSRFVFPNILAIISTFVGLVAFIMILIGGFKYLTSGGDQKALQSAKGTLTYAIFGIIALIGVWLILKLIETFTGVPVTIFKVTTFPTE